MRRRGHSRDNGRRGDCRTCLADATVPPVIGQQTRHRRIVEVANTGQRLEAATFSTWLGGNRPAIAAISSPMPGRQIAVARPARARVCASITSA